MSEIEKMMQNANVKKHSDCGRDCPSFGMFLSKLLSKLDIQEVE